MPPQPPPQQPVAEKQPATSSAPSTRPLPPAIMNGHALWADASTHIDLLQRRLDSMVAQRLALHNEALVAYGVVIALLVAAATAVSLISAHLAAHFTKNATFVVCMLCLLIFLGFTGRALYYLDSVLEDKASKEEAKGLFAAATIAQKSRDDFLQSMRSLTSEKAAEELEALLHAEAVSVNQKQRAQRRAFFAMGVAATTLVVALLFSVGLFGK